MRPFQVDNNSIKIAKYFAVPISAKYICLLWSMKAKGRFLFSFIHLIIQSNLFFPWSQGKYPKLDASPL